MTTFPYLHLYANRNHRDQRRRSRFPARQDCRRPTGRHERDFRPHESSFSSYCCLVQKQSSRNGTREPGPCRSLHRWPVTLEGGGERASSRRILSGDAARCASRSILGGSEILQAFGSRDAPADDAGEASEGCPLAGWTAHGRRARASQGQWVFDLAGRLCASNCAPGGSGFRSTWVWSAWSTVPFAPRRHAGGRRTGERRARGAVAPPCRQRGVGAEIGVLKESAWGVERNPPPALTTSARPSSPNCTGNLYGTWN